MQWHAACLPAHLEIYYARVLRQVHKKPVTVQKENIRAVYLQGEQSACQYLEVNILLLENDKAGRG